MEELFGINDRRLFTDALPVKIISQIILLTVRTLAAAEEALGEASRSPEPDLEV